MAVRNVSFFKVISRNSLLCFFTIAVVFMMSWLFILHSIHSESTTTPQSIVDHNLLSNSEQLSTLDPSDSVVKSQYNNLESPFGNRAILVDTQDLGPNHEKTETQTPQEELVQDTRVGRKCSKIRKVDVMKVFMYDLPPEFHFGLLDWKAEGNNIWPDVRTKLPHYPGGLNQQHSIEYWLTLDLLASEQIIEPSNSRTVIRVHNSTEADFIFVPFFSSLSYNRYSRTDPHQKKSLDKVLQDKLVKYLRAKEEWMRSGGMDHVILAHHPNSMLDARMKLWPATFILSDFGRYPPNIANVEKDVIAPYKHVIRNYVNDSSTFDSRPTLLYFQGAIYRKDGGHVRHELFYLLKNEKDVHFSFGSVQKDGIKKSTEGMRTSKFCLNIAGDTPSSNQLFDAIASHCIPVIISDQIELPYEDSIDYTDFCIFVKAKDALKKNYLINFVRSISKDEWTRMWNTLKDVERFFEFQFPSKEGDAVQMIWQAIARKVPFMRLKTNRSKRYVRSLSGKDKEVKPITTPRNFW